MNVIEITPRGYCHGVLNALAIVKKVIKDEHYPRPIYILGQIVHNQQITDFFTTYGVISLDQPNKTRLQLLESIETGTVIFTAHGVSQKVIERAKEKGLTYMNATCRDVLKVHKAIQAKLLDGYKVIYIGHKNHPEPEAILDLSDDIYFVENERDVMTLPQSLEKEKIFVTNQTTLSMYDIESVLNLIEAKFPNYVFDDEICNATTIRQQAVITQDEVDLMLVVGDKKSSISNKLVQVGEKTKAHLSFLIQNIEDIDISWLLSINSISVTSGASTPTSITNEVIDFLKQFKKDDPSTWDHHTKYNIKDIL